MRRWTTRGRCVECTCHFTRVDDNDRAVSRDVMKWYEPIPRLATSVNTLGADG
jgi:hypothetical protein